MFHYLSSWFSSSAAPAKNKSAPPSLADEAWVFLTSSGTEAADPATLISATASSQADAQVKTPPNRTMKRPTRQERRLEQRLLLKSAKRNQQKMDPALLELREGELRARKMRRLMQKGARSAQKEICRVMTRSVVV
ncbi:uncharacterized protein VTP21DRAFT_9154 [Calcarisporiella thermophila]|uniref:uncharacterized protein n=1 Tax=Calcarisporiella thermophila TaxID=911321 RepID=UPI0037443CE7